MEPEQPMKAGARVVVPKVPMTGHVPVRFPQATIDCVKRLADEDGMTVSSWIRQVVRRELQRRSPNRTISSGHGVFTIENEGNLHAPGGQ